MTRPQYLMIIADAGCRPLEFVQISATCNGQVHVQLWIGIYVYSNIVRFPGKQEQDAYLFMSSVNKGMITEEISDIYINGIDAQSLLVV